MYVYKYHFRVRSHRGNMSESSMSAPMDTNAEELTPPVKTTPSIDKAEEPTQSIPVKTKLKDYRQKLITVKARIRYREHVIKGFRKHLKNDTFPQRMKSIKPYPKMSSSEAQKIVNAACDQVQCVILDVMLQDEQKKLTKGQDTYQAILVQRQSDRQQFNVNKLQKPKKSTLAQLKTELAELQKKYAQLCTKLETSGE